MTRKIAYIISMVKSGVPAFTYREIDILHNNGFEIALFTLAYREGPYMPRAQWPVFKPSLYSMLISHICRLLSRPLLYLSLLTTALKTGTTREFALGMQFAGQMRKWGATNIHCHFGDSKLYTGYYCAVWLNLPMTVTMHAYEIHRNPKPQMLKIALTKCEKVVVQSEFNKECVMRNFKLPPEKIALIRAHGDMSKGTEPPVARILMVGEFRYKKGHEVLLSAVKKLNRKDIVVWFVGGGHLDVPQIAREMGLNNQTVFFGMVGRDILNVLYDSCDLFVLPSRTAADGDMEGIPAVLMEAMSHGKPVISTRHAGIPELVEEILVDENNVDELAEAIAHLVDNPELRDKMGRRNYEIVKAGFSDDAVLQLGKIFTDPPAGTQEGRHS
ncbi:MAG: glycosyltransferase family 4 protein [Armatimonadetes bacterium]|nr:glycosyltransferase family 4 protein [Armatimonadota bacterium]